MNFPHLGKCRILNIYDRFQTKDGYNFAWQGFYTIVRSADSDHKCWTPFAIHLYWKVHLRCWIRIKSWKMNSFSWKCISSVKIASWRFQEFFRFFTLKNISRQYFIFDKVCAIKYVLYFCWFSTLEYKSSFGTAFIRSPGFQK